MIDSFKSDINEQKMDKTRNLFDFAIMEAQLGNHKNAYELFGKILEVDSANFKALFCRELCNYRLHQNFENLKKVYMFCLNNADKETRNFCQSEFADVLVEISDYENNPEIVGCVYNLAQTLIGCEDIELKDYLETFQKDAETFLKVNKWNIGISKRKEIANIINGYKKILTML